MPLPCLIEKPMLLTLMPADSKPYMPEVIPSAVPKPSVSESI
jgi:hypothetical protein